MRRIGEGRRPRRVPRALSLAGLVLLLALPARAEMQAEASLSSNDVAVGEPFQLVISVVTDEKIADLPWPEVKGLEDFNASKASSNSSRSYTSVVNGRVSQVQQYITNFTYTLTARKPGSYTLGPITYAYGDFRRDLGSGGVKVSKQEAGLRLQPSLSKRKAYVGEQVTYVLRILCGPEVQKVNPGDFQKLIGEKFWFQHLDKNVEAKSVTVGGQAMKAFDIRVVLFPLLAGPAELPPIPVEYQQVSRRNRRRPSSVFDMMDEDFFGGTVVNLTATTEPMRLEALPLPPGAPPDFSGSVGKYALTASVDKNALPSGDALGLTVVVRGTGEPKSIQAPKLPDLDQFEVFDPEVTAGSQVQGNTLVSSKTFKYVLVPRHRGEFTIGPVGYGYFDPEAGAYATARSAPMTISVSQGKDLERPREAASGQREIAELGSDIRHIKTDPRPLRDRAGSVYDRPWFWGLFAFGPLWLTGLAWYRGRQGKLAADTALRRRGAAGSQVRKRLREAREAARRGEWREAHRALALALSGLVSDKLNLEFRGLTTEEARAALRARGVAEGRIDRYERLMQRCDFALYSGRDPGGAGWEGLWREAEELLAGFEKEL